MSENSFFYTIDCDIIFIYGVKWFAPKHRVYYNNF